MTKHNTKNQTFWLKQEEVTPSWFILDAEGKTLGHLAVEIARILRGKHRPDYTPHVDCGDGIILLNASKVKVTGNKEAQKVYRYHTGWMKGLREIPFRVMKEKKPEYIIEHAVRGNMSHNRLSRKQMKRLRVFAGEEHDMTAQKPVKVNI